MLKGLVKEQKGISLIETVVAVGLLAYIGVAILMAMQTDYKAAGQLSERVVADNLATAYLEAVRESTFADEYPDTWENITVPSGYSVDVDTYGTDIEATPIPWEHPFSTASGHTLQKITVTVSHGGNSVLSLSTYRAKR